MTTPNRSRDAIAVAFNVMYEQWSEGVSPGIGPMGNPLLKGIDHQALSWAGYGPRTGIANLLRLFADSGVVATFYTSGVLADTHPDSIRAIVAGGHAVQAHGWAQDVIPAALSPDQETLAVQRAVTALTEVAGTAPTEWVSPRCTPSSLTPQLVAAAGLRYFSDVFDDDLPYSIPTPAGDLIGIPFGMEINDLPMTIRYGLPIENLVSAYQTTVDARLAHSGGALVDVTVHAHIGGRPNGLAALRSIIALAQSDERITITTRVAAADHIGARHMRPSRAS